MIRIEAEDMTLSKYNVETLNIASGEALISTFSTGTATSTFSGSTGSYNIFLGYFDEKDGVSEIEVFIDDQLIKTLTLNKTTGSAGPDSQSFVHNVIGKSISLNKGSEIEIRGTKDGGEQARIDYIEFTPTSSTPTSSNPTNTSPTVFNDSFRTNERFSVAGNVFEDNGRGSDSDPDGDALSVVEVDGSAANVGTPFTLDSGALVTLDEDGALLYDPNNQLTSLNQGESVTERFTYTLSDGNGETATATVLVTVNGLDDDSTSNLLAVKDFETKDFSGWRSQFSTEVSGRIASDITRDGQYSARLQFKADDPLYNGKRRTEIFEDGVESGSEYWYGFSHYLPEDWVIDDSWTILAQWHGQPDPDSGEPHRVPPLDLLIVGDEWSIKHRTDADAISLSKSPPTELAWTGEIQEDLGTWTDWVFHTKWSHEDDGLLEVWKNGVQIVDYSGPIGFNDDFGPYFKAGVYSDKGDIPFDRQVYFDEYRLGDANSSYLEVAPGTS